MKKFITKHKKILILISIIIAVVLLLTTTAVTGFKIMPFLNPTADNIKTCSIPTGEEDQPAGRAATGTPAAFAAAPTEGRPAGRERGYS